jgi:hypothetical protein
MLLLPTTPNIEVFTKDKHNSFSASPDQTSSNARIALLADEQNDKEAAKKMLGSFSYLLAKHSVTQISLITSTACLASAITQGKTVVILNNQLNVFV